KWLVYEMERRYECLSANGCRNLREYNQRVSKGATIMAPLSEGGVELEEPRILPYIVLIIDELADLMMTVQNEIERPLAYLAQKARATGVHLVVATQRPSVNVITGLIKANFSCRIAFRVASKVDSRTIIDQNGAETLLGDGDMLFMPPGQAEPKRIQGTFVATEDMERLVRWYRARAEAEREPAQPEEDILEVVRQRELEEAELDLVDEAAIDRDPLFRRAAEVVIQHQQGSTSLLQRRLRIGYGRAARIVDQLEQAGIVGPSEGSKPREVLITLQDLDRICAAWNS
ncbi:MAG: DNA translocase FtsK, partial [Gemmatimonadota bacterium]